ncbi:MAG: PEP-utilizing enzyme [Patescibacteria group bacterium]
MLTKKKVKTIKWYRQSGAGIPLCCGMPFLALSERMFKKSGFYFPNDLGTFLKTKTGFTFYHYFDYFLTLEQVKKIFVRLKNNNDFFKTLKNDCYLAAKEIEKTGLAILKNKVISRSFIKEYESFLEWNMKFWENSLYIDLLDPFESQIIDFIFGPTKEKLDKNDVNTLLSPDELSNLQKEQKDLSSIYKIAKEKGIDSPEVKKLINKHSDNYYWLKNDYEKAEYLDEKYFSKKLKELVKNQAEVKSIINGLEKFEEVKKNKNALINKYAISGNTLRFLNFFNWVTTYRDDRKKYNQIANYVFIEIIEKISKEIGIGIDLLKYAVPDEIPLIIKRDKKTIAELKKRANIGLIVFAGKTTKLEVVSGSIAEEYFEILEKTIAASEIRGTTVSPGKVIGIAKIILNQKDFSKMDNGDVIVASMTRPEYVSIMKKAAAVITDEGGITCHAAIVSRELNIPCITGTQIATRSLADGDLIDVNANHGLVKIIKKAK